MNRARQKDEMRFAQRMLDVIQECRNVLNPTEFVKSFLRGLLDATRDRPLEKMRHCTAADLKSMTMVRKIPLSEGNAKSALLQ